MTSRKQDQPTVSRKNIQTVEVQLHPSSWRKIYFWNLNDSENSHSRGTASGWNNGPSVRSDRLMEGRTHSCSILNLYNSLESRPETIKNTIQHFIFLWAADLKQTHGEPSRSPQDEPDRVFVFLQHVGTTSSSLEGSSSATETDHRPQQRWPLHLPLLPLFMLTQS